MASSRRTTTLAISATLALALALTACGSSDDDTPDSKGSQTSTSTAAVDTVLGPVNKASAEELTVGFDMNGKSPTVDTSEEAVGAQAAVDYVNERLGGINGRPLKLQVCEDKGNPATGQECAQQFVSAQLPAVLSGTSGVIGQITKVLDQTGVANYAASAAAADFLASPNSFTWHNPLAGFGTEMAVARDKGLTRVASLITDIPAATGPAKQLIPLFAANVGATADIVPITPGTPDMTSVVQSTQAEDPQLFHLIGDPTFCTTAIKAIKQLGLSTPVVAIDNCVSDAAAKNIPDGFAGITISALNNFDPQDSEFQIYQTALDTYASGAKVNAYTANGFSAVLGFARVLNAAKVTDYTSAGLIAATKAAPPVNVPIGGGEKMQCTGTVNPFSKTICAQTSIIADGQADGSITNYRNIDSSGIYVMPKG